MERADAPSRDPRKPSSRFVGQDPIAFSGVTPGQDDYDTTEGRRVRGVLARVRQVVDEALKTAVKVPLFRISYSAMSPLRITRGALHKRAKLFRTRPSVMSQANTKDKSGPVKFLHPKKSKIEFPTKKRRKKH